MSSLLAVATLVDRVAFGVELAESGELAQPDTRNAQIINVTEVFTQVGYQCLDRATLSLTSS